jgi:hypothetical protein
MTITELIEALKSAKGPDVKLDGFIALLESLNPVSE